LEEEIEKNQSLKNDAVRGMRYEEAASYRDIERRLKEQLEAEKLLWEKESLKNRSEVGFEDIAQVVSMMSGVPITRMEQSEMNKLSSLEKIIREKVIGQEEAVQKIVKAIKRNRTGLKDPNRPGRLCGTADAGQPRPRRRARREDAQQRQGRRHGVRARLPQGGRGRHRHLRAHQLGPPGPFTGRSRGHYSLEERAGQALHAEGGQGRPLLL